MDNEILIRLSEFSSDKIPSILDILRINYSDVFLDSDKNIIVMDPNANFEDVSDLLFEFIEDGTIITVDQNSEEYMNEGTWAIPKDFEKRQQEGIYWINRIKEIEKGINSIFGDDILFDELDAAIKRIRELMSVPDGGIKESINEDVVIPPDLSNQYLAVKKQVVDKQTKKDNLMKGVNQLDNEINILTKNLLAIEQKAALAQGQNKPEENTNQQQNNNQNNQQQNNQQNPQSGANIAESFEESFQKRYDKFMSEGLDPDEIRDIEDEENLESIEDFPEDDYEENLEDSEDGESLEGDYAFSLIISDEKLDEDIIAKFYKNSDDDFWKVRVVQGDEDPLENMQFEPEMDMVQIMEKLATLYDDVEEISVEEYEDLLDDKEESDEIFYDDIINN